MKKIIALLLIFIFSFSLAACNNGEDTDNGSIGSTEIKITIHDVEFTAKLYDNETAEAFAEMLPMTLDMSAMAHEKYYNLPSNLPTDAYSPKTIQEGDIMLWGANCLVLFYESFSTSYSYTKIGKIENTTGLADALGSGSVTVKFELIVSDTSDEPAERTEPESPSEPTEPETPIEPTEPTEPPIENEVTEMLITINGTSFKTQLYDNQTAKALATMLPMTINMSELNSNEKYYYLPNNLPTAATNPGTIQTGDIMLYGSNCLVLFYKTFSSGYSYTKIGRIEDTTGLMTALGSGSVTITFSII